MGASDQNPLLTGGIAQTVWCCLHVLCGVFVDHHLRGTHYGYLCGDGGALEMLLKGFGSVFSPTCVTLKSDNTVLNGMHNGMQETWIHLGHSCCVPGVAIDRNQLQTAQVLELSFACCWPQRLLHYRSCAAVHSSTSLFCILCCAVLL